MDGKWVFICGALIAAVVLIMQRALELTAARKELCRFLDNINVCIRNADDNGADSLYYYGAAFGYTLSVYGRGLISTHDFVLLKKLIADSREKRSEIDFDKIKVVVK